MSTFGGLLGYVIIFGSLLSDVICFDFYREKPFFVNTCKISQRDFNKCLAESMQNAYKQIFEGIPGVLEKSGSLDPFYLDNVKFNETNNLLALDAEFSNVAITGFHDTNFTYYRINTTTLTGLSKFNIPSCRLDSKYRLNGRVLSLPFNSSGEMNCLIDDFTIGILSHKHLYKKDGFIFMNTTYLNISMDAGKMKVHYDNIFPDGGVNQIFNDLINDNWRQIFEAVRPTVETALAPIYLDLFQVIYDLIPITFFIEGLPTNGELYK